MCSKYHQRLLPKKQADVGDRFRLLFEDPVLEQLRQKIVFEDGINLGLISEEYALEYLINLVKDSINRKKYNALEHTSDRVAYLRALSINTLINDAVAIFLENESAILEGTFSTSIMKISKYKAQIEDIIDISVNKVYQSSEVIEKELKGYQVINRLLDVFVTASVHNQQGKLSAFDRLALACTY